MLPRFLVLYVEIVIISSWWSKLSYLNKEKHVDTQKHARKSGNAKHVGHYYHVLFWPFQSWDDFCSERQYKILGFLKLRVCLWGVGAWDAVPATPTVWWEKHYFVLKDHWWGRRGEGPWAHRPQGALFAPECSTKHMDCTGALHLEMAGRLLVDFTWRHPALANSASPSEL